TAQLVKNTAAVSTSRGRLATGCCRNTVEDVGRLFPVASHDAEDKRRGEETNRKNGRRAGQRVRSTASRHEPRTTANAKAAAFRALDEHNADKRQHDQQVNDNEYGLHGLRSLHP